MDFGVSTMGLVLVLVTGAQNCALCICSVLDGHLSHVPSQSSQPGSEAMARIFTLRPGQEEGHPPTHTHLREDPVGHQRFLQESPVQPQGCPDRGASEHRSAQTFR